MELSSCSLSGGARTRSQSPLAPRARPTPFSSPIASGAGSLQLPGLSLDSLLAVPGPSSLTLAPFCRCRSPSPPLRGYTLQMCPSGPTSQISKPLYTSSSDHCLPNSYSSLNAQHKCHLCGRMHARWDLTSLPSHGAWHPGGTHLIGPFLTLFLDESKEKLILLDEVYSFSEKSSPEMVAERKLII